MSQLKKPSIKRLKRLETGPEEDAEFDIRTHDILKDISLSILKKNPTSLVPATTKIQSQVYKAQGGNSRVRYNANNVFGGQKNRVQQFLNYSPELEVELSFGIFKDKFIPSVSAFAFQSLLDNLKVPYKGKTTDISSLDFFSHTLVTLGDHYKRSIVYINEYDIRVKEVFQKKIRDKSFIEDKSLGFRIYSSRESDISWGDIDEKDYEKKPTREKWTYRSTTNNFLIFASMITFIDPKNPGKIPNYFYEVEIERNPETSRAPAEELGEITTVLLRFFNDGFPFIPTNFEKLEVIERLNALVSPNYGRKDIMGYGWWNKPVDLAVQNLLTSEPYAATVKYDGLRKFVFYSPSGIYLLFPPYNISKLADGSQISADLSGTILDVEYMTSTRTIYAFDVLFHRQRNVRNVSLPDRLDIVKRVVKITEPQVPLLESKEVFYKKTQYQNIVDALFLLGREESVDFPVDGIIIQSMNNYNTKDIFKWKPPNKITIDFVLDKENIEYIEGENFVLVTPYVYNNKTYSYEIFAPNGDQLLVLVEDHIYFSRVVECEWSEKDNVFIPLRLRLDKTHPNLIEHANNMWYTIKNPISVETLKGLDTIVMRKYHNIIKTDILNRNVKPNTSLVDIGSGRGGDLSKWKRLKLQKIFAVEPNHDNLKFLIKRKNDKDMPGTEFTIISEPFQNKDVPLQVGQKVDVIASFFSLTFFYSQRSTFMGLVDNITKLLNVGGKFIGISMDGHAVRKYFGDKEEIDTEAFTLKRGNEWKNEPFDNDIYINLNDPTSMVKNQTEWLVDLNVLQQELEDRGFRLEQKLPLKDIREYILPVFSQNFNSLMTMFSFVKEKEEVVAIPTSIEMALPEFGVIKRLKGWDGNIIIVGNYSGSSSLISAFMLSFHRKFRGIKKAAIEICMENFRYVISKYITQEKYYNHFSNEVKTKQDWARYRLNVMEEEKVFSKEMMWILEEKYAIGIIITTPTKALYAVAKDLLELSQKYKKFVVLLQENELTYYPISPENAKKFILTYDQVTKFLNIEQNTIPLPKPSVGFGGDVHHHEEVKVELPLPAVEQEILIPVEQQEVPVLVEQQEIHTQEQTDTEKEKTMKEIERAAQEERELEGV